MNCDPELSEQGSRGANCSYRECERVFNTLSSIKKVLRSVKRIESREW